MDPAATIQIRQWNDPELLAFFNAHAVEYRLVGDHMFTIRTADGNVAAGLGDWLTLRSDGAIEVRRGDHARQMRRAVTAASSAGSPEAHVPARRAR